MINPNKFANQKIQELGQTLFQGDQMASFYISNENWDKGEEITLMNMNIGDDQTIKFMESITINEVFEEKKLKFLYVNDFLNMNIFYVEILKESDLS